MDPVGIFPVLTSFEAEFQLVYDVKRAQLGRSTCEEMRLAIDRLTEIGMNRGCPHL